MTSPLTNLLVRGLLLTVIGCLLAGCFAGRPPVDESLFLKREVTIGSNVYAYRVFIPKNRLPEEKLPVMLYLHGSDERGDDNGAQVKGFESIIGENPQNFRFIVVFPQCRRGSFWAGEMTAQAIGALDRTVAEFGGDERRLYLAGHSLGAFGVWQTAILYPKKFAALVPLSGRVLPRLDKNSKERAALAPEQLAAAESPEPYRAIAEKIGNLPVWVFHGKNDTIVPIGQSRKIAAALREIGNSEVNVTEYEDGGHLTVGRALRDPRLFEWLAEQNLEIKK